MENRGYEEDRVREQERHTPTVVVVVDENDVDKKTTIPCLESHEYEDIISGALADSTALDPFNSTNNPNAITEDPRNALGDSKIVDTSIAPTSKETTSPKNVTTPTSSSLDDATSVLRRISTLPLRRDCASFRISNSSVRVTNAEKNRFRENDPVISIRRSNVASSPLLEKPEVDRENTTHTDRSTRNHRGASRRRRKKDCKHCRRAIDSSSRKEEGNVEEESKGVIAENTESRFSRISRDGAVVKSFGVSEFLEHERNDVEGKLVRVETKEDKALIVSEKTRCGMRVNSIYSQGHWYPKETPIFFTNVKEQNSFQFQRAYSLPARAQTPSSQNRVNLRRSVRGEPPPHPARLHKHRHGWTLHLARPLEGQGCTRSLVLLLLLVLILLGIGAIALYIVFEPEKLQMIQQYLRSSHGNSSVWNDTSRVSQVVPFILNDESIKSTTTDATTLDRSSSSEIVNSTLKSSEEEIEGNVNSTRYCDDCLTGEVCVALVDEDVPTCRIGLDHEDPTGCAGFCLVNEQRCHRLDVDAFRCVEVEHYCLDDEWTCSNTLCIPLSKHCDGHMNCYDHSDEYNCDCNLETHFRCGNETSCLPLERKCDGKIDCWDASDEINCTLGGNLGWSCPSEKEFTCSNGECISKARFCDGLADCGDGSDEPHGCQGRCNKHEFTCQNTRCITKGMKCNGVDDCGDGTDERYCKDRFT